MVNSPFQPVNDPIWPQLQVSSCIEILDFDRMVTDGEISTLQVLFERIAQEIYNTRKKDYNWGFRVIEPELFNHADRITLVSKLYGDKDLADLNSVIFKLFTEFNNIVISTSLHMHIPVRGLIWIGEVYEGSLRSRKPAMVPGKDPLILSDLLKVFTFAEIFPQGYSGGLIPAVEFPFHFGKDQARIERELKHLDSVGIFMPSEYNQNNIADVTILSNLMVEADINGEKMFACNWKEWMSEHSDCSADNILAFAEAELSNPESPYKKMWKSLIGYTERL
jgi:hypothetical protein